MELSFEEMTPAQKRVAIAQDVIQSLKIYKIQAHKGVFVAYKISKGESYDFTVGPLSTYVTHNDFGAIKPTKDTQIQELVKATTCLVCALGSLFVEVVRKVDKITLGEAGYNGIVEAPTILKYLEGIFDYTQLIEIEMAFEGGDGWYKDYQYATTPEKAARLYEVVEFGRRFSTVRDRMEGIMRNIIENNGEFLPCLNTTAESAAGPLQNQS